MISMIDRQGNVIDGIMRGEYNYSGNVQLPRNLQKKTVDESQIPRVLEGGKGLKGKLTDRVGTATMFYTTMDPKLAMSHPIEG